MQIHIYDREGVVDFEAAPTDLYNKIQSVLASPERASAYTQASFRVSRFCEATEEMKVFVEDGKKDIGLYFKPEFFAEAQDKTLKGKLEACESYEQNSYLASSLIREFSLHGLPGMECDTNRVGRDFQKLAASDPDKKIEKTALPANLRSRNRVSGYGITGVLGTGQVEIGFTVFKEAGEKVSSARRKEIIDGVLELYNENSGKPLVSIIENNKSSAIILKNAEGSRR